MANPVAFPALFIIHTAKYVTKITALLVKSTLLSTHLDAIAIYHLY
jgi:hypothetical protein